MISEKSIYLLLTCLAITSAFSVSYVPQSRGRKLFGGYRIVPKVCQPTNPSRIKSDQPSICMFNYECSYRRGEVVGACTDGFLFGACCQLPSKQSEILDKGPSMDNPLNLHEIDHVPDIPILLNPDGTPVGITSHGDTSTTKIESPDRDNNIADANIKISTFRPLPSTSGQVPPSHYNDNKENAEKPQVPTQADFSHLDVDFPALLNQQGILNDLNLPALLIHSNSNDIQEHQDPSEINPVTTLLSPDQILQIADPVDQLPALFSQGLSQNNHASADTILLDENGTMLNETSNPDDLFKPNIEGPSFPSAEKIAENAQAVSPQPAHASTVMQQMESLNQKISSSTQKLPYPTLNKNTTTWFPVNTQSTSTDRITTFTTQRLHLMSDRTPADLERVSTAASAGITMNTGTTTSMSPTNGATDDLIRVPAIIYDSQSGNKKNDMLGHEEMSINHIISMLNDTTPNLESSVLPASNSGPPIHTWISVDETAKPSIVKLPTTKPTTSTVTFPYTFHKPGQMSSFYNYETTEATESSSASHVVPSNFYSSRPTSTQGTYDSSSFSYSTRPSTNPPAPTVIVLGPLGTEYTKYTEMTQQSPTRRPVNAVQPNITNVPNMSATITHNISTVISTNSVETNSNHVVSTSYISVNLKDITSTKPVMNKDGTTTLAVVLDSEQTTTSKNDHVPPTSAVISCDDETPAPDDLINFPPVRNPNLNMSIPASQQEKPTIVETFNNTGYPDIELLSENEIPTPAFIEDDMLTNKVNVFVNKIVESLQGNFEDLKDVVYNKKNTSSTPSTLASTTKRPTTNAATTNTTRKPVRRPIQSSKPSQTTSKRPPTRLSTTTQRPVSGERPVRPAKPTILKPSPATSTKKPQTTTKRTKPPRKPTIPITSTEAVVDDTEEILSSSTTISPISHKPFPDQDFRKECGIRPLMKTGRIVGGKGAKFGQWPWQVLVREATWLGLFTKNKCGGVLITNKYVVTAAHCQPGFLASLVAVFGEFDISGELETKRSVTRNIRRVIVNRGYDPATFENDLALLELETPIQFDSHIVPICMPEDGADFTGRIATVTGWGRLKYNGGVPSVLQEVQVPIIENSVCQEMFQTAGHSKLILDSFLCAGYANGQKDSCEGDSGGPLTMEGPDGRWMLVGTVSHGIKCAAPYLPGVYMRTTYFKPWLHSITGI